MHTRLYWKAQKEGIKKALICRGKSNKDIKSVILLPIYINKEQYEEATTPDERDKVIQLYNLIKL